jgi:hypothetical protein
MSPWVDLERASSTMGRDYVISWKPNPDIFVGGKWDADWVRGDLAENLSILKGNVVEIIMKDVSSLEYAPQRLWEWARIAVEESEKLA